MFQPPRTLVFCLSDILFRKTLIDADDNFHFQGRRLTRSESLLKQALIIFDKPQTQKGGDSQDAMFNFTFSFS